ncbi:50S ribosomal protein L10 [Kineococcus terrestris]|uniref:50S ribosomal protein L10 n=1 Tax=Kineococcus terrestris TaxID=2044856 RepID=UPI0034DABABB
MARADKAAAVKEIRTLLTESNAAVLTEYRGLSVAQLTQLRRALGPDTTYAVLKNTLATIAAKEAGVTAFEGQLVGPTAIAFVGGDPVEAAKGLRDFARTNPQLVVKGGLLDGRAISAADVTALADLESREVLLAKVAGVLKASQAKAAALFQAPLSKTVRTVEALREKQAAGAPAAEASEAPAAETADA